MYLSGPSLGGRRGSMQPSCSVPISSCGCRRSRLEGVVRRIGSNSVTRQLSLANKWEVQVRNWWNISIHVLIQPRFQWFWTWSRVLNLKNCHSPSVQRPLPILNLTLESCHFIVTCNRRLTPHWQKSRIHSTCSTNACAYFKRLTLWWIEATTQLETSNIIVKSNIDIWNKRGKISAES